MRKITLLIALFGMIIFQSCTVNDTTTPTNYTDNDTISEVWEYNRSFTATNNYSNLITFPHTIYSSDMVLVYRLSAIDNGVDVWKQLPESYFFSDGTLDFRYDFDFTRYDVNIFLDGYALDQLNTNVRINQVFRVVVVPGFFGNKSTMYKDVDFSNYNDVVAKLGVKTVKKI